MDAWIRVEDGDIRNALLTLIALGSDTAPAMADIGALGESSTRLRFRTQIGPDGIPWKPSLRAAITGGNTLTKDGHLADSINWRAGRDWVEWGVNRVYAVIHQFGGIVRPARKKALRFRLATGAFVTVRAVRIPPRPYLGVSNDDAKDILDLLQRRIDVPLARIRRGLNAG